MVSNVDEVYGFCLYHSRISGKHFAFINGKSGMIEQWELVPAKYNKISGNIVRTFSVGSQPEGMVADDATGLLYVAEEQKGIWIFDAEPDGQSEGRFIGMSGEENQNIAYDVEGLALLHRADSAGYLIASSQGNNSYAVFERGGEHRYITSFIVTGDSIDAVEETDGLDISSAGLNETFRGGVFVVQDGFNYDGDEKKPQNFKLIDVRDILELIESDSR